MDTFEPKPKGDRTRARILDRAVEVASVGGLGTVTIGPLAEQLGMSKSGLFAHFRSKEALQVETLDRAAERFEAAAITPVLAEPDKRKRLSVFFDLWLDWVDNSGLGGGCPIMAAAVEYDDVPGPVREAAARHLRRLDQTVRRLVAVACPGADTDAVAAAVFGLGFAHHIHVRLLGTADARAVTGRAFDALISQPSRSDVS